MRLKIDLNADLGEGAPSERELLRLVSSANIACGFHTGDFATMTASIVAAHECGVAVGAHPSFADRENFGRREQHLQPNEITALVAYQVGAFRGVTDSLGIRTNHVKPHGALYNMAAQDPTIAEAVTRAIVAVDRSLILFAPGESELARAGEKANLRVAREVFADRQYLPDGALVPRTRPDALLHDAEEAAARVLRILREQVVPTLGGKEIAVQADTVCVHGDTPEAVEFALKLRERLAAASVQVTAPNH